MKTFLEVTETPEDAVFIKSRKSGAAGHCVETAQVGDGVALRHSKDPGRGAFLFTNAEFAAFLGGVRAGDFDCLVS